MLMRNALHRFPSRNGLVVGSEPPTPADSLGESVGRTPTAFFKQPLGCHLRCAPDSGTFSLYRGDNSVHE